MLTEEVFTKKPELEFGETGEHHSRAVECNYLSCPPSLRTELRYYISVVIDEVLELEYLRRAEEVAGKTALRAEDILQTRKSDGNRSTALAFQGIRK